MNENRLRAVWCKAHALCWRFFIWGSSFFIMKGAVDVIPTFYLLAIRFTGGAALLALLCWKRWKDFTRDYLWRGAVIGGFLFLAYSVQTFGLAETTPSKNAFLTGGLLCAGPLFLLVCGGKAAGSLSYPGGPSVRVRGGAGLPD